MFHSLRAAVSAVISAFALCAFPTSAQSADSPRMVVMRAPTSIGVGGDCNNPAVWVGDRVHVFASPYAQEDKPAGVSYFCSGTSIERLDAREYVDADRSVISSTPLPSYGPWFESVIADEEGVLWAYYHAEFGVEHGLHPRVGAQVSYDAGATWRDLGVIIDTPAGTDVAQTHLGYGFVGGNGDFSAILDREREYVYFFISQYGASPETQGVAVARMRWTDRAQPIGNVWKKHGDSWTEPGLGGATTPILANVGDAHGVNAPMDFWWGPSIHWNHHLECYVILLSRSTTGAFTSDGPENWVMYGTDLTDASAWTTPVAIDFPNNYNGGWYPVAIGTEKYETDNYLGREARIFVEGSSHWRAIFLRPEEEIDLADYPTMPEVAVHAGDGSAVLYLKVGDTLPITSVATDVDGDMFEHWLELRAPSGVWSWEGWLTAAPWDGALVGDNHSSTKNVNYTFTEPGEYVIRATTIDPNSTWILSNEVHVLVSDANPPSGETPDDPVTPPTDPTSPVEPTPPTEPTDPTPPEEPANPPADPSGNPAPALPVATITIDGVSDTRTAALGATLLFGSIATDANGDMLEHWLELWSPDRSWSWEGWLTSAPWVGMLGGDGSRSEKAASFTFDTAGVYLVRASAVDSQGQWITSTELSVTITEP
jgi:hypothetical protein